MYLLTVSASLELELCRLGLIYTLLRAGMLHVLKVSETLWIV